MIMLFRNKKLGLILLSTIFAGYWAFAHCQIPCGIYGDTARFGMLREHIQTVEKSMNQINELSKEKKNNYNQLVRWVENKEKHADEIGEIVTYYFMAQRIKPAESGNKEQYDKYINKLTLLHQMLITSMKMKQTTDLQYVKKMTELTRDFDNAYNR